MLSRDIFERLLAITGKADVDVSLNELLEEGNCYMGRFLNQATDSDYTKPIEGKFQQRLPDSEQNRELGAGSNFKSLDIMGVMTYFPFDSDRETKPEYSFDGESFDGTKTNPILVFWKSRLVPHDLLKDLPILKSKSHNSIEDFRHRCCGILFFPPEMKIARNKTNLITDTPGSQVSFQWKNPDFLIRNPDFLLKNG